MGEINILTSDFSAEYAGIANVRVNTKRGGSTYHGSAFYNNKNSALAAWKLDDLNAKAQFVPNAIQSTYPNPYFNITDVGGSVGGPIPHLGKTWFFAAYERDYTIDQLKIQNNNIPHPSLYTGDFSALKPSAQPLVPSSVTLTPEEIANNTVADSDGNLHFVTIPSRLLNPTVQALINTYFPKIGLAAPINPKNGKILGGFKTILPTRSVQDIGTLRLDHDFSENSHFYGVYNVSSQSASARVISLPMARWSARRNFPRLAILRSTSAALLRPFQTAAATRFGP